TGSPDATTLANLLNGLSTITSSTPTGNSVSVVRTLTATSVVYTISFQNNAMYLPLLSVSGQNGVTGVAGGGTQLNPITPVPTLTSQLTISGPISQPGQTVAQPQGTTTGGLIKLGTQRLILPGSNTYTGN